MTSSVRHPSARTTSESTSAAWCSKCPRRRWTVIRQPCSATTPTTLLGDPAKRAQYFVEGRREYFFDRHRPSFDAIFAYLVEGFSLKRPAHVPSEIFLKEVRLFISIHFLKKSNLQVYMYVTSRTARPARPRVGCGERCRISPPRFDRES